MTDPIRIPTAEPGNRKHIVTIKKYANRRLYNTGSSSYVTLENLAQMVKDGIEFAVYDAKTGDEITRSVLTQIIVEEENKGQNLLPVGFLRQLIAFYGGNMGWAVPQYLEDTMQSFAQQQEKMRSLMQSSFGGMFPFPAVMNFSGTMEDLSKQNLAMMEKAIKMMSPLAGPLQAEVESAAEKLTGQPDLETIKALQAKLAEMQKELEKKKG